MYLPPKSTSESEADASSGPMFLHLSLRFALSPILGYTLFAFDAVLFYKHFAQFDILPEVACTWITWR